MCFTTHHNNFVTSVDVRPSPMTLTASIVAYRNSADLLAPAINSFIQGTTHARLFLVDNSPDDRLRCLAYHPRIEYIFNGGKNVGFGAGHNQAIRQVLHTSTYHVVINPDVYFSDEVLQRLITFMDAHPDIGQVMPKVLYPDGRLQRLCKLLPTPRTLITRRFLHFLTPVVARENYQYELQFSDYNQIMDVPFLSGCFMFLRTAALRQVGLFDERFFLYTEDTDLTRRIHRHFRTVYFPEVSIFHHHARGSYKSLRLLAHNIHSAVRYFNKWGWTRDEERERFNTQALLKLNVQA